ncbi:MAG: hypothetical protein CFE26_09470 [Verrucomicrobiales bacterium VVV1]|nr:MAG: hypothetical protein CFE26_09470 [Verrucomicrobiales bacterium VVV1]
MFKKVIGQDNSDNARQAPSLPDTFRSEPPAPAPSTYQAPAAAPASRPSSGATRNVLSSDVERIRAEIKPGTVVVYGKIHGNITVTDRVELKAGAEIVGDIKAKTLAIDAGAIFVGKSTVGTPASSGPAAVKTAEIKKEAPKEDAVAGVVS